MGEKAIVNPDADTTSTPQGHPADAANFPLVQYLPIGVLVRDEQGVVSLVNQALIDAFGLSRTADEFIGRPFAEVNAELATQTVVPEILLSDSSVADDENSESRIDVIDDRVLLREVLPVSVSAGRRRVYLYRDATAEIRAGESAVAASARICTSRSEMV